MNYLLHHLLRTPAQRHPDREALVVGNLRWTYGQWWSEVLRVSQLLREQSLERGDRVGIWLPAGAEQAVALLAISAADAAFVPIHISLFPQQVAHILADGELRLLITTARGAESLAPFRNQLPELTTLVLTDAPTNAAPEVAGWRWISWHDQPNRESTSSPSIERCIEKDLAAILYTSGSTGLPKGVMLSHANLLAGASIVSDYLQIRSSDRILAVLPFSFDAGLNQLTTAIQQEATLVIQPFVMAKQIVQSLVRERITGLAGVPTLWGLIAQSDLFQRSEFPDLRYVTNTGGKMPVTTLAILRRVLKSTEIFLMYGLTEAFRSTYLPPDQLDHRPDSMGRAIPNTEILVVNERGQRCQPGEIGELVHHGPTVALGYWKRPEVTDAVWRPHPFPTPGLSPHERVCYSGDLVRQDAEGYLYFVARRDNQIKTSGFRVSPTEVEEVLYASGRLAQAAVIGVPDELLGQRLVAYATSITGDTPVAAEILQFCATRLPAHMIPKEIEFLDQLPTTTSNKVDYNQLRKQWEARYSAVEPNSVSDASSVHEEER